MNAEITTLAGWLVEWNAAALTLSAPSRIL